MVIIIHVTMMMMMMEVVMELMEAQIQCYLTIKLYRLTYVSTR